MSISASAVESKVLVSRTAPVSYTHLEDSHVARQFFRAWGENWKKATPVWLILLAVAALCGFDLYICLLYTSRCV